ncbi:MAG: type II toxin-antitoxin system VapC family toxin [Leptospirales bacterium]|nr:type II toxin-antitoxin system VapC family toxin [Leptospirales bacterium]
MTYVVDTHTLLWALFKPDALSQGVKEIIGDRAIGVYVSAATFWEISLKYALGKLELKGAEPEDIPEAANKSGFEILGLDADVLSSYHRLVKTKHRDPFDRMIIWHCI